MKDLSVANSFMEASPLAVFLVYVGLTHPIVSSNWLAPYLAGSFMGILVTIFLLSRQLILNRLFLGIHIYFITGTVGLILHWDWLNKTYGYMQASGMLAWIILVGFWTLLFSQSGFLGVKSPDIKKIQTGSLILLFSATIAFIISYLFTGNRIMSELIPFGSLFFILNYLKSGILQR